MESRTASASKRRDGKRHSSRQPETSTTYTSSHLCAMAIIAQVAVALGADFGDAMADLPNAVADILAGEAEVWPVAEASVGKRIYAYGAGPNEVTATELMIKVREAAFHSIDGMAAEQFLHGPTISFNAGILTTPTLASPSISSAINTP